MSDQDCRATPYGVWPRIVRWIARGGSLASIGFMLAYVVAQRANPFQMQSSDLLLFLCFPSAVGAGVILAWFWELGGAVIALGGLTAFYAANRFLVGDYPPGWKFVALTAPGILFLVSAVLRRLESKRCAPAPTKIP